MAKPRAGGICGEANKNAYRAKFYVITIIIIYPPNLENIIIYYLYYLHLITLYKLHVG